MDNVVSQMLVMLLVVLVGFLAQKFKLMGDAFDRQLSNLVINLTCPCLIVSSVMGDVFPKRELILPLLLAGFLTYVVLFVVCSQLPRLYVKDASVRGIYSFMLMFGNVGFIGYPVAASIFGDEAVFYASLLNVANTLSVFVCGVVFILGPDAVGRHRFNWRVLYCPGLVASYISILIVLFGLDSIPKEISEPLRLVGNITVPGSLLIIGSSMAVIDRRHMLGSPSIYLTSAFRLLAIPVGVYFLFRLIGIDETINRINTILIGMPVASFGTMFCLTTKVLTPLTEVSTILFFGSLTLLSNFKAINAIGIISASIFVIHPFMRMVLYKALSNCDIGIAAMVAVYVISVLVLSILHHLAHKRFSSPNPHPSPLK